MSTGKIIILGASGFVGSNLLKELNNCTGVSLRNSNWKKELVDSKIIINLVGKAHDHDGRATKEDYKYANVEIAKQVYSAFVDSSAEILIHISSLAAVEEYEARIPLMENDPCSPQSWYGKTKREAESWLLNQKPNGEKKVFVLRPPMIHGPGDKGNLRVLFNFFSKGLPYPLGAFKNQRSFICIDNFIYFIEEIIEKYNTLKPGLYHLADDEAISTHDIVEVINEVTGKKILILSLPKFLIKGISKVGDFIPLPLNSIKLRKMTSTLLVSNKKLKSELNIDSLRVKAKEGVRKTIKSFI